jgi:pimeloyl-ACP methyl ester carboxylesterase
MTRYAETFFKSADGLKLYFRDYAGGAAKTPVLCLHGLTRNCRDFESLALRLSPERRVITPDQRGRGRSQYDTSWLNYSIPTYVSDTWRLLNELGIPRVIVIGTSMGGIMAMVMASMQVQAIAGVVLNDVGAELDVAGAKRIAEYCGRLPPVRDWDEAIAQMKQVFGAALPGLTDKAWRQFTEAAYVEDANGIPRVAADPKIGDALRTVPPGSAPGLWLAWSALKRLPVLVLRGAHSDVLSAPTVERMRETKPDLQTVVVPGRGHPPLLNESESLRALDAFFAGFKNE